MSSANRASRSRSKVSSAIGKRSSTSANLVNLEVKQDTGFDAIVDAQFSGKVVAAKRFKLPTRAPKKSSAVPDSLYNQVSEGRQQGKSTRSELEDPVGVTEIESFMVTLAQQPRIEFPSTIDQEVSIQVAQSKALRRTSPRLHQRSVSMPPASSRIEMVDEPDAKDFEVALPSSSLTPTGLSETTPRLEIVHETNDDQGLCVPPVEKIVAMTQDEREGLRLRVTAQIHEVMQRRQQTLDNRFTSLRQAALPGTEQRVHIPLAGGDSFEDVAWIPTTAQDFLMVNRFAENLAINRHPDSSETILVDRRTRCLEANKNAAVQTVAAILATYASCESLDVTHEMVSKQEPVSQGQQKKRIQSGNVGSHPSVDDAPTPMLLQTVPHQDDGHSRGKTAPKAGLDAQSLPQVTLDQATPGGAGENPASQRGVATELANLIVNGAIELRVFVERLEGLLFWANVFKHSANKANVNQQSVALMSRVSGQASSLNELVLQMKAMSNVEHVFKPKLDLPEETVKSAPAHQDVEGDSPSATPRDSAPLGLHNFATPAYESLLSPCKVGFREPALNCQEKEHQDKIEIITSDHHPTALANNQNKLLPLIPRASSAIVVDDDEVEDTNQGGGRLQASRTKPYLQTGTSTNSFGNPLEEAILRARRGKRLPCKPGHESAGRKLLDCEERPRGKKRRSNSQKLDEGSRSPFSEAIQGLEDALVINVE